MAPSKSKPASRKVVPKAKRVSAKAKPKAKAAPAEPKPQTLTPYLAVNDAAGAIEWYKKVFGAKEFSRQPSPDGKIMHAGLVIGDSQVLLSDIFPGSDLADPTRAGASVNLHVWSPKADKFWANATSNGAKVTMPLADQFWGDRYGKFVDPYGHNWAVSTKSKLSKAQLEKLRVEQMKQWGG